MNTGAPSLAIESAPQHQLSLTLRNRFAILSNEEKDFPVEDDQPPAQEKPRNPELCKTENLTLLPEPRDSLKRDLETFSRLEPQNLVKESMNQGSVKTIRNPEISNVNQEGKDNELLRFNGKINGHATVILIDSGSTHDLISEEFLRRHQIQAVAGEGQFAVTMADGRTRTESLKRTTPVTLVLPDLREELVFTVFPLARYDVILGKPWLSTNNPTINYSTNEVQVGSSKSWSARTDSRSSSPAAALRSQPDVQLNFISGKQARHALRKGEEGFMVWVTEEKADVCHVDLRNDPELDLGMDGEQREEMLALLREYRDTLPNDLPMNLPPERLINHEIDLEPYATPPSKRPYRLSQPSLDELQTQLTALLDKGFIEPSNSPFGAPVFFVKKSDGTLRLVCDWRELNRITIKNEACLPNIDDLFDTVQGSLFFTKLDLHAGYNQVRIRTEDVPKTAFNTPLGHYQFKVMGFGLCNAPATFQALMNQVLRPYLRKFVVVFLDDILIFSRNWKEHLEHVRLVLQALRENQLYCKPKKCVWGAKEIHYLGHILSGTLISPDPSKLQAVKDWPTPTTTTQVRSFLGFANYFRRFVKQFADLAKPLDELTGKNTRFQWNDERQNAFEGLKQALLEAPVLHLADVSRPFQIYTDASDLSIAAVLLQAKEEESHPVAYASRKLTTAEKNYTIAERETLAVVFALKCWRLYLFKHFDIYTDNQAVVYLRTKAHLSKREVRWSEFMAEFHFTVHHIPGRSNTADGLSRQDIPVAQLNSLELALEIESEDARLISEGYSNDPELSHIIERLTNSRSSSDSFQERYLWDETNERLYLIKSNSARLCIPKGPIRLKLLQESHDCFYSGHMGRDRTFWKLSQNFYWPRMGKDVKDFVLSCESCQRNKSGKTKTGLLQPLPLPERPWVDISMDLIVGLPLTEKGHDAIFTFVDRLTKYTHLIPTKSTITAEGAARVYIDHVFSVHGLSKTIVSDRDPRFTAAFFKELFSILGSQLKMSTANHPQTDGMTERMNRVVEDTLRTYVNHKQTGIHFYLFVNLPLMILSSFLQVNPLSFSTTASTLLLPPLSSTCKLRQTFHRRKDHLMNG